MNNHLQQFMQAVQQQDEAIKELIRAELRDQLTQAEHDRDLQAENLKQAYDALQQARKPVETLEAEISFAEANAETWIRRETGEDIGYRVEAPVWQSRWADEISKLRDKLIKLQADVRPFEQEYSKQKQSLETAEQLVTGLTENLRIPYYALGQKTEAYQLYRCNYGSVVRVLTMTDDHHPEWDTAMQWFQTLADLLGFDLIDNGPAKRQRANDAMWHEFRERTANNEPASGGDVTFNGHAPEKDDYRFRGNRKLPYVVRPDMEMPPIPPDIRTVPR